MPSLPKPCVLSPLSTHIPPSLYHTPLHPSLISTSSHAPSIHPHRAISPHAAKPRPTSRPAIPSSRKAPRNTLSTKASAHCLSPHPAKRPHPTAPAADIHLIPHPLAIPPSCYPLILSSQGLHLTLVSHHPTKPSPQSCLQKSIHIVCPLIPPSA